MYSSEEKNKKLQKTEKSSRVNFEQAFCFCLDRDALEKNKNRNVEHTQTRTGIL